ncbi:sensor histidine kinase [Paenibacillus sp. H1-7]|uniref:sensor histidine kinase n=1 Tax=Paenibacillus sp. H1-7 TaxID=2282849 RepID=UPI001EF7A0B4|nr:HAMP domain-containing sensor histidine kinase [Paenibacillus sp. H1-7]ULL18001.1 sensor histidine kinase [Paenibacillus sp. H1-7]
MIYFTLLFIVCTILITYRKRNSLSTRFMFGMIVGWVISFVAYTLYLSKFNYYYNIIHTVFNFSPGTWNYLVLTKFNANMLIRMLNGGILLFTGSLLCFAVSFTRTSKRQANAKIYAVIALLLLIQYAFFDPGLQIALQGMAERLGEPWGERLTLAIHVLERSFRYAGYGMIAAAFGMLLNYYINYPKIRFLKNYALYHILSLIPVVLIHFLLFSWAPKNLVIATYLEGYYNYQQPPIGSYPLTLYVFPYVVFAALTFLVYITFKYNSIEVYHKNQDVQINKSIDTASLGARAFTHAVKNHLLAVRSEAEYLREKHADDSDTAYSLDLMLKSCSAAMESINDAVHKLKSIELNLQPSPLDVPVRQALTRFKQGDPRIQVTVHADAVIPSAYMDTQHMTEAVYNIMENAAESLAGKPDGSVSIHLGLQDSWGMIAITDNGPGMPEEHLDMIFSPFFSTKPSINNWGIGLSYCHKIVTGHDGKISVESKVGQGTTFRIYLPAV